MLTKIETRQYAEAEPVDLARLLHHLMETYGDFARHKQMAFDATINAGAVVPMNQQLAEVMLANLLKNAIHHGQSDQPVKICLSADKLSFVNAGDPLST